MNNAAMAAINFALDHLPKYEIYYFLAYWREGDFEHIRIDYPEAPEEIYIGADPIL
jgi:hypothetical protein